MSERYDSDRTKGSVAGSSSRYRIGPIVATGAALGTAVGLYLGLGIGLTNFVAYSSMSGGAETAYTIKDATLLGAVSGVGGTIGGGALTKVFKDALIGFLTGKW